MKKWLFIVSASLMLSACEMVNYRSSVPNVPVNYTLYITTEHPHFIVENGFQTLTITASKYERESIGYAGLLIWTAMDGHYHAVDLCCPNCLKRNKPVAVDGLFAICPLCDEQYDLSWGYAFPKTGKTKESLKKYQALLNNSPTGQVLRITN